MKKFIQFVRRSLVTLILLLVLTTAIASSQAQNSTPYIVDEISVQLFDRTTNRVRPFSGQMSELPNPIGANMDLLVSVKLINPDESTEFQRSDLTLSIHADGYYYATTGEVPPWDEKQVRSIAIVESNQAYIPFLVEYQCYNEVELTAQLPGSRQTKAIALPCLND